MIAVIFEVRPKPGRREEYLGLAADLRPLLEKIDSLSFFREQKAVDAWRNTESHRRVQRKGREDVFENYRLRIAGVIRDYGLHDRDEAPPDSRSAHG